MMKDIVNDFLRGSRPDTVDEEENTVPRNDIPRVIDNAKVRDHIFHVCSFDKFVAAEFEERNARFCQLNFEIE